MLPKATEDRLMHCVEAASSYAEDGDAPDAAIVKAARECNITRSEVPLIVRAYNISRTNQQREFGNTVAEKAASFPIANTDNVLAVLFPEKVKTAAEAYHSQAVDAAYSLPPLPLRRKTEAVDLLPAHVKQALAKLEPRDGNAAMEHEQNRWRQISERTLSKNNLKNADVRVAAAKEASNMLMAELEGHLAYTGSRPYSAVKIAVSKAFGLPGTKFLEAFESYRPNLWRTTGQRPNYNLDGTPKPEKSAEWESISWDDKALQLVSEGIRLSAAYCEAKEDQAAIQKTADIVENKNRPYGVSAANPISLDEFGVSPRKEAAQPGFINLGEFDKEASWGIPATAALVSRNLSAASQRVPDPSARVDGILTKLTDPRHEQQLASVGVQAMMADLMSNDPVISTYDPNEVIQLYNRLADLAPMVARHPLSVAPVLRKSLQQGQLDTFDVDQLVQMNRKMSPGPDRPI